MKLVKWLIDVAGYDVWIKTHSLPDPDELFAIYLATEYGDQTFLEDYCYSDGKQYVLELGIGGGPFDEHPHRGNGRKRGECCATLVAEALGVENYPTLKPILSQILNRDLYATGSGLDLAIVIQGLNMQYPDNPAKVYEFTTEAFEGLRERQVYFLEAAEDFEKSAEGQWVIGLEGQRLWMVTLESDNPMMATYARSENGENADIVIIQNSLGQVSILTKPWKPPLNLGGVASIIRVAEAKTNRRYITRDREILRREGKVFGAEEWYFFPAPNVHAVLNGGPKYPEALPTNLTLYDIQELVKVGLRT